jgi:hypothetical protein
VPNVVVGQMAGAHELSEAEGGTVEDVVAKARDGGADPSEFGVEGGARPGAGVDTAQKRCWRGRGGSGFDFEDPVGKRDEGGVGGPLVGPPGVVEAWRGDDVAAVSPHVHARSKAARAVGDVGPGMGEPVVATAASGANGGARREGAIAALEFGEGAKAAVVGVYVENDDAANAAGADGDVGGRPPLPPAGDGLGVGGGVVEAPWRAGVLRRAGAVAPPARAAGWGRFVAGEHGPASVGVVEGGVERNVGNRSASTLRRAAYGEWSWRRIARARWRWARWSGRRAVWRQRRQAGVDAEAIIGDLGQVEVDESGEGTDDG